VTAGKPLLPSALQGHLILAAESWPRLAMQILQSGVSFFIWNLFRNSRNNRAASKIKPAGEAIQCPAGLDWQPGQLFTGGRRYS